MKIIIELKDFEDKERVLNYIYCILLDNPELKKFSVELDGTDLKRRK